MNWLKKKPVFLSITLLLTACSTPYKPYGFSGGYQDEKTAEGEYNLSYVGNGVTSKEKVRKMWHRRAAELCDGLYDFEYLNEDDINHTLFTGGAVVPLYFPQIVGTVTCQNPQ